MISSQDIRLCACADSCTASLLQTHSSLRHRDTFTVQQRYSDIQRDTLIEQQRYIQTQRTNTFRLQHINKETYNTLTIVTVKFEMIFDRFYSILSYRLSLNATMNELVGWSNITIKVGLFVSPCTFNQNLVFFSAHMHMELLWFGDSSPAIRLCETKKVAVMLEEYRRSCDFHRFDLWVTGRRHHEVQPWPHGQCQLWRPPNDLLPSMLSDKHHQNTTKCWLTVKFCSDAANRASNQHWEQQLEPRGQGLDS